MRSLGSCGKAIAAALDPEAEACCFVILALKEGGLFVSQLLLRSWCLWLFNLIGLAAWQSAELVPIFSQLLHESTSFAVQLLQVPHLVTYLYISQY
jgi:hypothetical protein